MELTREFVKSCRAAHEYPLRLVGRSRYGRPFLEICRKRFEERQQRLNLFVENEETYVPYWDVDDNGRVDQRNLLSEADVATWLGDEFREDATGPGRYFGAKRDPLCRFIFLVTSSSTKPMELTPASLKRILTYYQVMPSLLDFLYVFGGRNGEDREVRFSGFRSEKALAAPAANPLASAALNRSGRRYQLCYNIKRVALKDVDKSEGALVDKAWKIRQAAIYHQFDVGRGTQLWLVGDPHCAAHELIREHVHEDKDHLSRFEDVSAAFRTSLETHLLYCRWANQEWRWHIESHEEIIERLTQPFREAVEEVHIRWQPAALVKLQDREEKLRETVLTLETNADTMARLREFYEQLVLDHDFPETECVDAKHSVTYFATQLGEQIHDVRMQIARAKILVTLAADRKLILIQHLQAQATARQEELTTRQEELARRAGLETIAVRIITVITLVYLPATFVSTFFSTDVVKYQGGGDSSSSGGSANDASDSGESYSGLALQRFFEVSVPLMVITFGLAFAWYRSEKRKMSKAPTWGDEKSFVV